MSSERLLVRGAVELAGGAGARDVDQPGPLHPSDQVEQEVVDQEGQTMTSSTTYDREAPRQEVAATRKRTPDPRRPGPRERDRLEQEDPIATAAIPARGAE